MDNAMDLERRGEWEAAAAKYRRASQLFAEARLRGEAEDALRRAGTCALVANR
ncbi:MAG: hypothetical protein ACOYOQ_00230 [Microthrixaceae bacterium]